MTMLPTDEIVGQRMREKQQEWGNISKTGERLISRSLKVEKDKKDDGTLKTAFKDDGLRK
jgi:hypothetical protein